MFKSLNTYYVIKKAISKDLAEFLKNYLKLKKEILLTYRKHNYISEFNYDFGFFLDSQVPDTFSIYSATAMETLLETVLPKMEKITKLKLVPNYSYARIYKKGDILGRHKDRFSCEVSTTLNLGGDLWPIFLDPSMSGEDKGKGYIPGDKKGIKVNLSQGDMLVYPGVIYEHWREKFEGNFCAQVFLHYNSIYTKDAVKNKFDTRPHLGLPAWFQKK